MLCADDNQEIQHRLIHYNDDLGVEVSTTYINGSDKPVTLEMLSSFCLGGITPFIEGAATGSVVLHRLRSKWSSEARLETVSIEDLQLEPSWAGYGVASEKFGQIGSMPVRNFFPFAALEDTANHILWGVRLACPSSWQMEVYRRDDGLCVSGGLADYDFGHWCKTINPGESFTAPTAYITVCEGDIDKLCSRLLRPQFVGVNQLEPLPVVFNEYCATWGCPTEENVRRGLNALKGHDIDYFVIDAGWYAEGADWYAKMGDWEASPTAFPNELKPVADAIRDAGLKPGIWFEPEVCGYAAKAYEQTDHLLKRNGTPVTVGTRRFWDMRDGWVSAYLDERVIGLLKSCGFEYVKIDYNDSIGVGCDGAESLGEGLRQNMLAAQTFFKNIRERIPGIVVENCASGGHRLEESFLSICQLASCSDAHEEEILPVIAANLHRAMQPGQGLIWAVLRQKDSPRRIIWSLCATFLGVMCLSGDVYDLSPEQWEITDKGIRFYRMVSHIIQNGTSVHHGPKIVSCLHPKGWQAVERASTDEREKLIVVHAFGEEEVIITIDLGGEYFIRERFAEDSVITQCDGKTLTVKLSGGACGVFLFRKNYSHRIHCRDENPVPRDYA